MPKPLGWRLLNLLPWWGRWAALGALCAVVAVTVGVKVHAHDKIALDALQGRFDAFKAQVSAEGKRAEREAARIATENRTKKEQADAENARTRAADAAAIASLRRERDSARGSFVPPAAPSAIRPDLACFDRAVLESALGGLLADIRGIADEGAAATVDLDTAKLWAKKGP